MHVVVVGAGLGGLAATAHLLGDGHDVLVLERDSRPGGRAGMIERDGFRLDNGPTVLTMPGLLADVFAAAGADMADHVTLRPVDPMYRATYADGSVLHVRHDAVGLLDRATGPGSAHADQQDRGDHDDASHHGAHGHGGRGAVEAGERRDQSAEPELQGTE